MESLESKKFDSKNLVKLAGGEKTTYGTVRETRYDGMGGQNGDSACMTYNPAGYPPGTQGADYIR